MCPAIVPVFDFADYLRHLTSTSSKDLVLVPDSAKQAMLAPFAGEGFVRQSVIPVRDEESDYKELLTSRDGNDPIDMIEEAFKNIRDLIALYKYDRIIFFADPYSFPPKIDRGKMSKEVQGFITNEIYQLGPYVYMGINQ